MQAMIHAAVVPLLLLASGCPVMAGPLSGAVKTGAKMLTGKAAAAAAKQAAKQAGKQVTATLARETAEVAAKQSVIRLTRLLGDDAIRVVRTVAGKSVTLADDFALAASKVSARNGRRLEMLVPALKKQGSLGRVTTLVNNSPRPDALIEQLWKHREKIAAGVAVTALVLHGDDIVEAAAEHVAKPVIESTVKHVVAPTAARMSVWGIGLLLLLIPISLALAVSFLLPVGWLGRAISWLEWAWHKALAYLSQSSK